MTGITFTTKGFAELEKRLKQLATEDATRAGQSANRAGAAYAARKVRDAAPVGPTEEGAVSRHKRKNGSYRESKHSKIKNHVRVSKGKATKTTEVANRIFINAFHSYFVEVGSIHNAPTHFFQKTMESEAPAILEVIGKTLNRILTRKGV